jgi:hypothetical protein
MKRLNRLRAISTCCLAIALLLLIVGIFNGGRDAIEITILLLLGAAIETVRSELRHLEGVLNFFEEKAVYCVAKEATRLGWHPKTRIQPMSLTKNGSIVHPILY